MATRRTKPADVEAEAIPVVDERTPISIEMALRVIANNSGDAFYDALADIVAMHVRKSADYGTQSDAHANIKASEAWGVPSWVGSLIRGADKDARIQKWLRDRTLANESLDDSILDKAVYSVITLTEYKAWKVTHGSA